MSIEKITTQIKKQGDKIPPVELWDPDYCGEIDLQIKSNGDWFYNNTIFKRPALVKLLASVLKKEQNDYFLVTPVEKLKISVEDAPFVLTQWQWLDESNKTMLVKNNVDNEFILNEEHPITINTNGELYVTVRRNLLAKVHRNIYYQWVNIATETQTPEGSELILTSAGCQFSLSRFCQ